MIVLKIVIFAQMIQFVKYVIHQPLSLMKLINAMLTKTALKDNTLMMMYMLVMTVWGYVVHAKIVQHVMNACQDIGTKM